MFLESYNSCARMRACVRASACGRFCGIMMSIVQYLNFRDRFES